MHQRPAWIEHGWDPLGSLAVSSLPVSARILSEGDDVAVWIGEPHQSEWAGARRCRSDANTTFGEFGDQMIQTSLTVGAVANAKLKALQDGAGKPTRVSGAVAHAALELDGMQVASAKGSRWADPDMRSWDGDSGTLHNFNWSA
jgi:hypothetical protein